MMNAPFRPPLSSIVPENALFGAEQRQWLSGFFLGLLETPAFLNGSATTSMLDASGTSAILAAAPKVGL